MSTPDDLFPHDFSPAARLVAPPSKPPRRARSPLAISEIVSWCVILVVVGFIVVRPFFIRAAVAAQRSEEARYGPDAAILMTSRSVVGLNALRPLKASGLDGVELQSLDSAARNPWDQLRAAIVRGEIGGRDAGEHDLNALVKKHPELAPDVRTLTELWAGKLSQTSVRWQTFRRNNGWFADLAASQGKPASNPLRASTINAGIRTMAVSVGAIVVAGTLGLVGLVLLIIGAVLFFQGRLRPAFDRTLVLPTDRRTYVQGFALYLGLYAGLGVAVGLLLRHFNAAGGIGWSMVPLVIAFTIGVTWPLVRGQGWREWRKTLGLHGGRGIFREICCGVLGYITGLPILFVGYAITLVLVKASGLDASHPITREFTDRPASLVFVFLLASVWAPITEEIMFRGALFGHLRQRLGFWFSAIPVCLIFAAIHPQGWPTIPLLASIALVLAGLREFRGSIIASMTAHALTNTLTLLLLAIALS